jgi:hypothetical protein
VAERYKAKACGTPLLGFKVRIMPEAWLIVLCVLRQKGKTQDNRDKGSSRDKVQENLKQKIPLIPLAERSKDEVNGRSLAGVVGSSHGCLCCVCLNKDKTVKCKTNKYG